MRFLLRLPLLAVSWLTLEALAQTFAAAADEGKRERQANRLAGEKSPYLLQHAHNPVDWYPWGTEAFEKARREDKPVFLSIGYSTCHWCHVMERESFENEAIAAYLNEHYVSIKVDREERPDVDQVYMEAVQRFTRGNGGWPLSVFLTPAGKPFYGGTYFPPADDPRRGPGFLSLLKEITRAWKEKRDLLDKQAEEFTRLLAQEAQEVKEGAPLQKGLLNLAFRAFRKSFDEVHGGFAGDRKFPRTVVLDFLLKYSVTRAAKEDGTSIQAAQMVYFTLDAMIRGGIRDHLAGGFHRYSTDRLWLLPHFEKMLYDQALIARTLAGAFRLSGNESYRRVARETMSYVLSRLGGPDGELYSAEDADTEGVEGKTYTWRRDEILKVLGKEKGERFADFYGALPEGNFEEGGPGASVLHETLAGGVAELAQKLQKPVEEVSRDIEASKALLRAERDLRPQPLRDDKVLVEWNGLAISALAHVYQVTEDEMYLNGARRAARFILERMTREGKLLRRFRQGEAAVDAFLEDYAFLIDGLIDLYESSFESLWLEEALRLGKEMLHFFWDEKGGAFYSSGGRHEALIIKTREFYDGAVPSGNSVAFLDLLRLGEYTGDKAFIEAARRMEKTISLLLSTSPESHPLLLSGASFLLNGAKEIVIAGPAGDPVTLGMVRECHRAFLPEKILLRVGSAAESARLSKAVPLLEGKGPIAGKPAAFVCRQGVCKLPARDLPTFQAQLAAE
jgi:hypothetical protein